MSTFGFQTGMTLKALLENPNLQNPLLNFDDSEKKEDGKESPRIDMGSAFLGPNLWDKTYDLDDFKLEYMDLDEFLCENGLPIATDDTSNHSHRSNGAPVNQGSPISHGPAHPVPRLEMPSPSHMSQAAPPPAPASPPVLGRNPSSSPASSPRSVEGVVNDDSAATEDRPVEHVRHVDFVVPPQDLALVTIPVSPFPSSSQTTHSDDSSDEDDTPVSESDLALARLPGQDEFDPRKHKFTDDDLKPQPMIKKSKKVFVPDSAKDDRYWCRRKKNNVAAKRSRDARRVKENQIAMRASYLERENTSMKEEVEKLRRENIRLKAALSKYEKQS